jgi:hypothetical protein
MRTARRHRVLAEALAAAFLDGEWSPGPMAARGALVFGRPLPWLTATARRLHRAFDVAPSDRLGELADAIRGDPGFEASWSDRRSTLRVRRFFFPEPAMAPVHPEWQLPALATTADLATWLEEDVAHLTWLADWRGLSRLERDPRLAHYVYRWMPKRAGGMRLLEAPKPRLKAIQRRILRDLLDRVPPHESVHGFRRGRSVFTHAAPHVARAAVLRMDLEEFFVSIRAARICRVFRALGYPEEVSRILTGLCTSRAPATGGDYRARQRYRTRHLPQGAPTSPALANLCAFRLDVRLSGLASTAGAEYTRYADDLVFSGAEEFARAASRFSILVAAIALEEGFRVQHRKTRLMRPGVRQEVTGLVVNAHVGIGRAEIDRLRATLHNCVRFGPETQNRGGHADFRAHLEGAVAWVKHVQPGRAEKLEALLRNIRWPSETG